MSREQNGHSARVLKREGSSILEDPPARRIRSADERTQLLWLAWLTGAKSSVRDRDHRAEELRLLSHIQRLLQRVAEAD